MRQETALNILKTGRNVFITGEAGAGKTHVLNQYVSYLREKRVSVAVTASTGIAATHLSGTTVHSFSGIGARDYLDEYALDSLTQRQNLSRRFENLEVLIVDEISMLSASFLESLDRLIRALRRSEMPFGGLQVVFSGDFFQLPPVQPGGGSQFAYIAPVWDQADIRVCYLSEQFRQSDNDLIEILSALRRGELTEKHRNKILERMGAELTDDIEPTRLYTHNKDADTMNKECLEKLPEKAKKYTARYAGRKNLIENFQKSILAPENLELKEGAAVMFVKNNFELGYANGTRGKVIGFENGKPIVRTLEGKRIVVEEAEWKIEEDGKVLATATQLPLRLAWAITVHKSQGMSLDAIEIDLSKTFTPGQGYVALSRGKKLSQMKLHGIHDMAFEVDERVRHFDNTARKASKKWETVVDGFSPEKLQELHNAFLTDREGRVGEGKITQESTYAKTKGLLDGKRSVKEIAKLRKLTPSTIAGHIEEILKSDPDLYTKVVVPKKGDYASMVKAFKKCGDEKVAPAHAMLKGIYSYEVLRTVRAVERAKKSLS